MGEPSIAAPLSPPSSSRTTTTTVITLSPPSPPPQQQRSQSPLRTNSPSPLVNHSNSNNSNNNGDAFSDHVTSTTALSILSPAAIHTTIATIASAIGAPTATTTTTTTTTASTQTTATMATSEDDDTSPFPILSLLVEPTSTPSSLIQELLAIKQEDDEHYASLADHDYDFDDDDDDSGEHDDHMELKTTGHHHHHHHRMSSEQSRPGEPEDDSTDDIDSSDTTMENGMLSAVSCLPIPSSSASSSSSPAAAATRLSLSLQSSPHRKSSCEHHCHHHHHHHHNDSDVMIDFSSDNETKRRHKFELVTWEKVPLFLRNNPFIRNYYRTYFSFSLCLKSVLRWHNETMNIWTHLLGTIIFSCLLLYTLFSSVYRAIWLPSGSVHFLDVCIMLVYECLAINCFLSSTLYHTFNCHSKKTWHVCYKCDLSAISGLIGGSFFPALYFQLRCYMAWQITYITSIAIFALLGMIFPFMPVTNKERAIRIFRAVRTLLFLCMVGSAIIPVLHWFIAWKPLELTNSDYTLFIGLVLMLLLYGVGLVFWIFKLPERFYPGSFDLIGQSHNIWHIFILMAAVTWWVAMNMVESSSRTTACPKIA